MQEIGLLYSKKFSQHYPQPYPLATTTLISHQPSSLWHDPSPAKRIKFAEGPMIISIFGNKVFY
jgi:hypothetical protein